MNQRDIGLRSRKSFKASFVDYNNDHFTRKRSGATDFALRAGTGYRMRTR
jgi:hypothetical protein